MPTPHEKLAESLTALEALQKGGRRVIQSNELSRAHRERLLTNGFLQEVMKGWLISSSPGARAGDSTPWYASLWEFCARYCSERFDDEWHLSPEQSLLLLAENTVIPRQVVVYSPKGTNERSPDWPARACRRNREGDEGRRIRRARERIRLSVFSRMGP